MTAIHDLPQEQTFGYGFSYAVWSANTTVTLANVAWNNDYRDVVRFGPIGSDAAAWRAALDDYLDNRSGPVVRTTGVTYAAMGRPIRLQIPFEVANTFNYLRAHNPGRAWTPGDVGRSYYYFVVGVNYIAPDTTELLLQLDVFQSFGPDTRFGNIYLDRGHAGIANEESFTNYGKDFLTVPEGFDLGNEYQISHLWFHHVATAVDENGGIGYEILVASSTALDEDPGTVDAPKLMSAKGSLMENLPNGAELYVFYSLDHFKAFMEAMSDKPWITAGIMSIQAVPPMGRYGISTTGKSIGGVLVAEINGGSFTRPSTAIQGAWRNQVNLGRYWRLKKFLTYPYMVVEMTANTGTPLALKPECWQDPNATIVEVPHFAPPNAKLGFYPYRYNAATETGGVAPIIDNEGVVHDGGEHYGVMTSISNFPSFSVVNNGYMMFMASNANNIAYQNSSADWSQQRATQAANTGYDQATVGMQNQNNQTAIGQDATVTSTAIANEAQANHTMVNGAFGVAGGIARGAAMGPMGALTGGASGAMGWAQSGLNTAIDTNARNAGANNSINASQRSLQSNQETAGFVRDTNRDLAQFSAQGDYANAIAGINAKVQDAKLTQPTTSGQIGGDAFNLATYRWGVDLKVKTLQPQVMAAVGEFWLRYGYAVNRFTKMPASLMVMDKFTYWKCKEVYVTEANCPETYKQTLRGIFEKGVTVWKNPGDIGNIDTATNAPLAGVHI